MKNILLTILLCPILLAAQNYDSQNVTMLGNWHNNPAQPAEPVYGIKYQGVWGWYQASTNKEYAIIGTSTGTSFIDVTDPANPVECDYIPAAHGNLIWHEIKTYQNYCYIVSDDSPPNTFIIADMSYLPDSVHVVRNDNTIFERCHTIYVDGDFLYGANISGVNSSFYYSMAVYDLAADPESPTLVRALNQDYPIYPGYAHDMFVRDDTSYVSCGYDGLHIFSFRHDTVVSFTEIAALTSYPEQGYNHSSFLTADGNTLIFMDEVPDGRGIKSLDVSDFGNLTINQVFRSNVGVTPHNPYIIGNYVLISANYCDGLQIFNISDPSSVVRLGYFDTDTLINFPNYSQAYHGCWGAYTDLPSGNLLASDMQNGLYIFDISAVISTGSLNAEAASLQAFPNPFATDFFLNVTVDKAQTVSYKIYDNSGRNILSGSENLPQGKMLLEIPAEALLPGVYSIRLDGETVNGHARLIKTQ
ncbi:MAG TPA: choice-of-anchor B family protein [Bacteroidia bacterium]|nr:choice-of-anchor B family protein [Bacteroidia bacterium]